MVDDWMVNVFARRNDEEEILLWRERKLKENINNRRIIMSAKAIL